MIDVVLASSNPGKIKEFTDYLKDLPIRLIPQSEFKIRDIPETGSTFVENAILKARHAAAIAKMPAIADDSGLVIYALNGAPGVRSARYAGAFANDEARIQKVLTELAKHPEEERTASFHCVTVLMESEFDPIPLICEGIWDGTILHEPLGTQGFGYDPIFHVPTHNCSAAQLDLTEKNKISHRGQALAQLAEVLADL